MHPHSFFPPGPSCVLVACVSAALLSGVNHPHATAAEVNPLLGYITDDTVAVLLLKPRSLIEDTELSVMGDLPFLGEAPIAASAIEHLAIYVQQRPDLRPEVVVGVHFKHDFSTGTLRHWLAPSATPVENQYGVRWYEQPSSDNGAGPVMPKQMAVAADRVALVSRGYAGLDHVLRQAGGDPSTTRLAEYVRREHRGLNLHAMVDVGRLRSIGSLMVMFDPRVRQYVDATPASVAVLGLEAAFGRGQNRMQLRLTPAGAQPLTPELLVTPLADTVATLAEKPLGEFRSQLPQEATELVDTMHRNLLRFLSDLRPTVDGDDLVLHVSHPPSVSRTAGAVVADALKIAVLSARQGAREMQLRNNLKQVVLAFHNYESKQRHFPQDIRDTNGAPLLSWRVALLPYLGEEQLYKQFKLGEPWDSEHNQRLLARIPSVYQDVWREITASHTRLQGVTGPGTVLGEPTGLGGITDGSSQTVVLVNAVRPAPWTKPQDVPLAEATADAFHYVGQRTPMAFADGHVSGHARLSPSLYEKLFVKNDGGALGAQEDEPVAEAEQIATDPPGVHQAPALVEKLRSPDLDAVREATAGLLFLRDQMRVRHPLAQVLLAWHQYYDTHNRFPSDKVSATSTPLLSWRVRILPYLGEAKLYNEFHLDEPWNSDHNQKLIAQMPDAYRDTAGDLGEGLTRYAAVTGAGAVFGDQVQIPQVTDGLSKTATLIEAKEAVVWTKPQDVPLHSNLGQAVQARGDGKIILGMLDGRVLEFSRLPGETLTQLFRYQGGLPTRIPESRPAVLDDSNEVLDARIAELLQAPDAQRRLLGGALYWRYLPDEAPATGETVRRLLADPDPVVRQLSIHSLAQRGTADAAGLLLNLRGGNEARVDEYLRDHLSEVAADAAAPLLASPDKRKRLRALEVLGHAGTPRHLPAIKALKSDPAYSEKAGRVAYRIEARAVNPNPDEFAEPEAHARHQMRVTRRDRLWGEAQQLLQAGKRGEAYRKVFEMLELEREMFGGSHKEVLDTLNWLASQYYRLGRLEDSKRFLQHRAAALANKLGSDHPEVRLELTSVTQLKQEMALSQSERAAYQQAAPLMQQAADHSEKGAHADAIEALVRADRIYQETVGADGVKRIAALRLLRNAQGQKKDFAAAAKTAEQLVRLVVKHLGAGSPITHQDLSERAYFVFLAGDRDHALRLFGQMLQLSPPPESRALFADNAKFLAEQLNGTGRADEAAKYYRLALTHADSVDHKLSTGELTTRLAAHAAENSGPEVAWRVSSVWRYQKENPYQGWWSNYPPLADQMHQTGKLHLELALRSALVNGLRQGVGEKKVNIGFYVKSLAALARTYLDLGDFLQANQTLSECSRILGDYRGEAFVVDVRLHQADVARHFGMTDNQEAYLKDAVEISQQKEPDLRAAAPQALGRLAEFYSAHGRQDDARDLLSTALTVAPQATPAQKAAVLTTHARVAMAEGKDQQAHTLLEQGLGMLQQSDVKPSDKVEQLGDLARLHLELDKVDQAEVLIQDALSVAEQAFGGDSLFASQLLHLLARAHEARGQEPQAQQAALAALNKSRRIVENSAYLLSPRQQLAFSRLMRQSLDLYLSLAHRGDSPREAYEQIYLWKGSGLVRERAVHRLAEQREAAPLYEAIAQLTTQLASLTRQDPPSLPGDPEQRLVQQQEEHLRRMTLMKDRLEAQLSAARLAYLDLEAPPSVDEFLQKLPADAVFIDYFVYERPGRKQRRAARRLLATTVSRDGGFVMRELGDAASVETLVQQWRATLGSGEKGRAAGVALRKQLLDPLTASLAGAKTLLISPDDILGCLPFHALPARDGSRYLIEDYRIAVVPTPQVYAADHRGPRGTRAGQLLLVGDVAYDPAEGAASVPPEKESVTSHAIRGGQHFTRLPGAREEVLAIQDLFKRRGPAPANGAALTLLADSDATEAAFRDACGQYAHLHIATHGYFAPPTESDGRAELQAFNPGLLSGLALAGANGSARANADDGVLTAEEIALLDLEHVELAVLSACETGLGRVAGGEGLIGIQRAFQVAGADAVVASLWKVPDQATRVLMERFYDNYWGKQMSQLDALREAQVFLLNNPASVGAAETDRGDARRVRPPKDDPTAPNKRLSPESWAAFILAGETE